VVVEYEDLPTITQPEEAIQPGAPLIHEKGNLLFEMNIFKGDIQAASKNRMW